MSKLDRFLDFDRKIEQILSAEKDQHFSEHTESALGGRGGISVGYPPTHYTAKRPFPLPQRTKVVQSHTDRVGTGITESDTRLAIDVAGWLESSTSTSPCPSTKGHQNSPSRNGVWALEYITDFLRGETTTKTALVSLDGKAWRLLRFVFF